METIEAQLAEAERLWNDTAEDPKREKSVALYRTLAETHAAPMAIYRMGCAYHYGMAVEQDYRKAMDFLSHASIESWRWVAYMRGAMYAMKEFAGYDPKLARKLLQQAHDQGVEAESTPLLASLDAEEALPPAVIDNVPRSPNCLAKGVLARTFENSCTICGLSFEDVAKLVEACPSCGALGRTRALPLFLSQRVKPWLKALEPLPKLPLLGFSMTGDECLAIKHVFPSVKSVSLNGAPRQDHELGVDARDLSRYKARSFCGSFGVFTFDLFVEQEQAIAEAARTTAPGGVFIHQFSDSSLVPGDAPPVSSYPIRKTSAFTPHVPDDHRMVSMTVGIDWYMKTLNRGGFDARHANVVDPHSGLPNHWFLGVRRKTAGRRKN